MDEVKAACQATSEIAVSDGYLRIAAARMHVVPVCRLCPYAG